MINKKTAILFIFFANIALLAHAVVPHHHHNHLSGACMPGIHTETKQSGNHIHPDCNHEHHGHESPGCCKLKQAVSILSGNVRYEKNLGGYAGGEMSYPLFLAIILSGRIPLNEHVAVDPLPLITFLFPSCAASPAGLRAPPAV